MKLTRDLLLIGAGAICEKRWTMLLSPLALLVPAVTFLNYQKERKFGEFWAARILSQPQGQQPQWLDVPQSAMEGLV